MVDLCWCLSPKEAWLPLAIGQWRGYEMRHLEKTFSVLAQSNCKLTEKWQCKTGNILCLLIWHQTWLHKLNFCTVLMLRGWSLKLHGAFPYSQWCACNFSIKVAYQNFTNTHWVKGHCNWYLGSLPTNFFTSSLNFQTPLIFSKKTCQSRFFFAFNVLPTFHFCGWPHIKLCQHWKMEMPGVLQSLSCDRP